MNWKLSDIRKSQVPISLLHEKDGFELYFIRGLGPEDAALKFALVRGERAMGYWCWDIRAPRELDPNSEAEFIIGDMARYVGTVLEQDGKAERVALASSGAKFLSQAEQDVFIRALKEAAPYIPFGIRGRRYNGYKISFTDDLQKRIGAGEFLE